MPRPKLSSKEKTTEEKRTIQESVEQVNETIEDNEVALYKKLAEKYKDQEAKERVPGKVIRGIKVAWTYNDMLQRFNVVAFTPEETIPLTWNGVKVQAYAGIEMHVPEPFYEIYKNHGKALREKPNFPGVMIELGAGGLSPDK